jgi:hypothetical protein
MISYVTHVLISYMISCMISYMIFVLFSYIKHGIPTSPLSAHIHCYTVSY